MVDLWIYCKAVGAKWFDDYGFVTAMPGLFAILALFFPETWILRLRVQLDRIAGSGHRREFYIFLVLAGIFFAGYSAWDEQYQKANEPTESIEQQIQSHTAPLQSEIESERQDNVGLHSQVNDQQAQLKQILASMNPGLKKEMLVLATDLTNRTFQILLIMGDHPPRSNIPPPTMFDPKTYEKIVKDREDEVALLKGKQQEAHQDAAELVTEYNDLYASRIVAFRLQCIQMGQADWHEESYYQNPKSVVEIQLIGEELLRHANELKS